MYIKDIANSEYPENVWNEIKQHYASIYSPDRSTMLRDSVESRKLLFVIDGLNERLQCIIRQRYKEQMLLKDIATYHSVSNQRVRQLIAKALRKVQESIKAGE